MSAYCYTGNIKMNSRMILENYGLTTGDLVTLVVYTIQDMSVTDLRYMLMHIEMEIDYRENTGQLDD